jgi:hypothetical protein
MRSQAKYVMFMSESSGGGDTVAGHGGREADRRLIPPRKRVPLSCRRVVSAVAVVVLASAALRARASTEPPRRTRPQVSHAVNAFART